MKCKHEWIKGTYDGAYMKQRYRSLEIVCVKCGLIRILRDLKIEGIDDVSSEVPE